jgi:cell pole-organizing protein PopZ
MNEQRSGAGPSTADMVAGIEGHASGQAAETQPRQTGDDASGTDRRAEEDTRTTQNGAAAPAATAGAQTPLLTEDKAAAFRARWDTIQASFVDEPRQSVEQADSLVAEAIKHLAEVFAQERSTLEEQWSRGDEVSTDALRLGLQRYRSFFQRLLAV